MSQNIYGPGSSLIGGHYVQSTGTPSVSSDVPVYADTSGLFLVDSGTKLSDKLSVNGSLPMTGVLDMGNHDIKNTDDVVPNTTAVSDIGTSSKRYRAAYVDNMVGPVVTSGLLSPAVTNTDDLGSSSKRYKTLYYQTLDPIPGAVVGGYLALDGSTTMAGDMKASTYNLAGSVNTRTVNNIVSNSGTGASGSLASFASDKVVQDAGITASNVVTNAGSGTSGRVATFASDKVIQDGGTLLSSLLTSATAASTYLPLAGGVLAGNVAMATHDITDIGLLSGHTYARLGDDIVAVAGASAIVDNVTTFSSANGRIVKDSLIASANLVTNTTGAVVSGDLPVFSSTTGRLVADSGILSTNVVQGPASVVSTNLASYNGTTGKLLADAAILSTNVLTNTGGAVTANQIPVFSGTGGRLITNSSASVASGVVSATRFIPSSPSWFEGYTNTGGTTAFSAGVPKKLTISNFTSPANSNFTASGQVITYNGTETANFDITYKISSTQQASAYTLNYGITTNASTSLSVMHSQTTSTVAGPLIDLESSPHQVIGLAQNDTIDVVGQCSTSLTIAHPVIRCIIKQVN